MDRLVPSLVRSSLMFLLSVLLVAGFYVHGRFYEIGLYPLIVLGGLATFLVITAARLIMTKELPRGRPSHTVKFTFEEGDRIVRKVSQAFVRPLEGGAYPRIGQVVWARYETGQKFGRLLVVDETRRFLSEVTEADAHLSGYTQAELLRQAVAARWRCLPDDVVSVVRFRLLGGTS